MSEALLPHLFRTEYTRITAVLCRSFGITHLALAEDIASDTFLVASEMWGAKGIPENPTAWLYTVAKNKAKNELTRKIIFETKIAAGIKEASTPVMLDTNWSEENIFDSQLQMIFAVCDPAIPADAQIGLALRVLCGFGIDEIAAAFLTTKETINKRLFRAKEKLRALNRKMEFPAQSEMKARLANVLTTLYLLFNEGYYSALRDLTTQKDLCAEAMRLTQLLTMNVRTDVPEVNALLSLMCFQASRLDARTGASGETILYDHQDMSLWDRELIVEGQKFLTKASVGTNLSAYHLEAAIAYWHTKDESATPEKWESILQLYNQLLQLEYSPIVAMNRTFALSKANGKAVAIEEALKLKLENNHLYHSLLGHLFTGLDGALALEHYKVALSLAKTNTDKEVLKKRIEMI